ncbi:MAG: HNH endonuclease signature motif containing protein [Limnospira sp. PMC 1291.21]|uniref:HNH endonuclease n=2 Tax=Limnospira TaxID=2596745 RepID=B5W4Q8_LIMMA|nr:MULTISPECIES: HNH endonuclease signature motif containing protein [Limnospira]EKD11777.1 HNH endonuclease [Arthrospira platensis C1]QJB29605.1 HNH endonuclease [Limnospira fusiformis SAG 85.79]EDZ93500.1 HNH endonuclease [Limnospira maxima CS-328]MDT9177075.1 HNH endonuclease signature motif containing protein [Limnospira sp. PMC 1238.20]MDT9192292.1 HNH endonuclease signature motif containing protein [Limnospira sp. PMC 1245.20]
MLRAWTVSRCGKANRKELSNYCRPETVKLSDGRERHETWLFCTKDGHRLWKHSYTPIVRHTLIRPEATLYDGNWTYWATRKSQAIDTPNRVAKLLKKQKCLCAWCGQYFTPSDLVEVDHIVPRSHGGKDEYKNLQLLHRHTRDDKTALDNVNAAFLTMEQSARASHQEVFRVYANYLDVEAPLEPYEVKVSSTVLNGRGRW